MEPSRHTTISISTGTFFRLAFVAILFWLLFYLRDIVVVILTSIVIASFVEAAVRKLEKYRFNRTLTAVLVYFTVIASITALAYAFVPVLVSELRSISGFLSGYIPDFAILDNIRNGNILNEIGKVQFSEILRSGETTGNETVRTLAAFFGGIFDIVLILVVSFYLSVQEKGIENFLRMVLPFKYESYGIDLWRRTERKLGLWIQGQLLLGLIIGAITYVGLLLFGVPYALLLALLTAVLELIPFGIYLAIIPGFIFSYVEGGLSFSLWVTVFYVIVHQFEHYIIAPLVVKRVVGISPIILILSILIGFKLAGVWGILLAVPVIVALLEFISDFEKKKNLQKENSHII